jgi:hypothetical protein
LTQSKIRRRRGMPMTYTTIATEATAVHRMCSPFERKGREGEEDGMMRVRKTD